MGRKALKRLRRNRKKAVKASIKERVNNPQSALIDQIRMLTLSQIPNAPQSTVPPSSNDELFNLRMKNTAKTQELENFKKERAMELQRFKDMTDEHQRLLKEHKDLQSKYKQQKKEEEMSDKFTRELGDIKNQISLQNQKHMQNMEAQKQRQEGFERKVKNDKELNDERNKTELLEKQYKESEEHKQRMKNEVDRQNRLKDEIERNQKQINDLKLLAFKEDLSSKSLEMSNKIAELTNNIVNIKMDIEKHKYTLDNNQKYQEVKKLESEHEKCLAEREALKKTIQSVENSNLDGIIEQKALEIAMDQFYNEELKQTNEKRLELLRMKTRNPIIPDDKFNELTNKVSGITEKLVQEQIAYEKDQLDNQIKMAEYEQLKEEARQQQRRTTSAKIENDRSKAYADSTKDVKPDEKIVELQKKEIEYKDEIETNKKIAETNRSLQRLEEEKKVIDDSIKSPDKGLKGLQELAQKQELVRIAEANKDLAEESLKMGEEISKMQAITKAKREALNNTYDLSELVEGKAYQQQYLDIYKRYDEELNEKKDLINKIIKMREENIDAWNELAEYDARTSSIIQYYSDYSLSAINHFGDQLQNQINIHNYRLTHNPFEQNNN